MTRASARSRACSCARPTVVEAHDARRAALQAAVGEAANARADVEHVHAGEVGHRRGPRRAVREQRVELLAAAADEPLRRREPQLEPLVDVRRRLARGRLAAAAAAAASKALDCAKRCFGNAALSHGHEAGVGCFS